jgi:hypothetical protein
MSPPPEGRGRAADPSRFQFTGGLLERSIYVERAADRVLPEALLAGEYCHILAPRQIGKTSLCFRAARELTRRGVRCALVDVTAAGTPSTTEEWYFGLVDEIARRLRLPDPLDVWQKRAPVAPAQRFRDYVRALVEDQPDGPPVVIFLDEIEMVRLAPVDVDDFLLILRSFHEERGQSPALRRLSFCLIGVTTPNDLIKNKSVTPFNVSKPVRVDDFTRAECDALGAGFEDMDASTPALLDAVYGWTDGHPYMTMRTCFELARRKPSARGSEQAAVDAVVRELFIERPLEDTNLNYAARRFEDPKFERDGARLADKIQLYRTVLLHKDPPAHNESAVQMELRICGMVKDVETAPGQRVLRPRNRIYETALDAAWLRTKGDRRFLSEAVWKWLDAGKDDAALLRGVVLEKSLAWAKTNALSEDEQAFLDASQRHETQSLEAEHSRITKEVVRVQTATKEAGEELDKVRGALDQALAEKRKAEASREELARAQTKLKASMKSTKTWLYTALMGLLLVAVVAGALVQKAKSDTREEENKTAAAASAAAELRKQRDDLQKQVDELKLKEEEVKKKDDLLKAKDEELKAKDAQLVAKDDELNKKTDDVKQLEAIIQQQRQSLTPTNQMLLDRALKAEKAARACEVEMDKPPRQYAAPPGRSSGSPGAPAP